MMKILKFETKNHPILGNCALDFSNDGNPCDFVLIGGENGTGKTTILEETFNFLSNMTPGNQDFDISISFFLNENEINIIKQISDEFDHILEIKRLNKNAGGWKERILVSNSDRIIFDKENEISNFINKDLKSKELFKFLYSVVEVNFTDKNIQSITAKDIDSSKNPKERSSTNLAQDICQLLIDIKALDDQENSDWIRRHEGKEVKVEPQGKRLDRFREAFSYMLETKKFSGVKNEKNRKIIYFSEGENEIDINYLSSGEKQIIFRAAFLLKNLGNLKDGIILIDEPEISLHPKWQEKYIKFLRKIFTDGGGVMHELHPKNWTGIEERICYPLN